MNVKVTTLGSFYNRVSSQRLDEEQHPHVQAAGEVRNIDNDRRPGSDRRSAHNDKKPSCR